MENIIIREIKISEHYILKDLLYEAIYQPDRNNLVPKEIVELKEIKIYIDNFGKKKDDYCFVADHNDRIVGAVWVRLLTGEIKGYGNIDNVTPEFAISLFDNYRNQGLGTALMNRMIEHLKQKDYKHSSLSVHKDNYAVKLYNRLGFQIIEEREDDYIMRLTLY
jgi:ribosomal protein S18 acetylase RimI-like enzyme